ncbi:MAG: hypothetical protein KJ574_00925, partial [Nanoarchaeota archaeon]|nr:hypothetical protein [Nanoarchaeota archaeon]
MRKHIILVLIVLLMVLATGCAEQQNLRPASRPTTAIDYPDKTIEDTLKSSIEGTTSLIAIKEEAVSLTKGASATDYILIKNAYDKKTLFKIKTICDTCLLSFQTDEFEIEAGDMMLIKFSINSDSAEGIYEQSIKITDALDNAYAVTKIMVTIE